MLKHVKNDIECIKRIVKEYQTCCEKENLNLCSNKINKLKKKSLVGIEGGGPLSQP
jgi:hypothetical protein